MARLPVNQIRGLTPIIDATRIDGAVVMDGANFYMDADGPVSGFAKTCILRNAVKRARGVQTFRVRNDTASFIFTSQEVLEYNAASNTLFPRLLFTSLATPSAWTQALVGGKHYFARKTAGLIQYDPATNTWTNLSGGSIPVGIVACASSGGRLVVLASAILAWSVIDDGADFTPSTVTGAGFQSLAKINSIDPSTLLTVIAYPNGVITYTTEGIMRSELTNTPIPFRHEAVSLEGSHLADRPINTFCIETLSQSAHVLLTRTGLKIVENGQAPKLWQPAMSEHLHDNILPNLDLNRPAIVRLHYDADKQWLFVSIASKSEADLYTKAFVLYTPANEWGIFNQPHTAMIDVFFNTTTAVGFSSGFLDHNGTFHIFNDGTQDLLLPNIGTGNFYDFAEVIEWPARIENSIARMPMQVPVRFVNESALTLGPGLYVLNNVVEETSLIENELGSLQSIWDAGASIWDSFITSWDVLNILANTGLGMRYIRATLQPHIISPLNSFIKIGLFRGGKNEAVDELSELDEIWILSLPPGVDDIIDDWMNDYPNDIEEDWMVPVDGTEDEDYGIDFDSNSDYQLTCIGTYDGIVELTRQRKIAVIARTENRGRLYTTSVQGLHHVLQIDALEIGQSFHIRLIEVNLRSVGVLT